MKADVTSIDLDVLNCTGQIQIAVSAGSDDKLWQHLAEAELASSLIRINILHTFGNDLAVLAKHAFEIFNSLEMMEGSNHLAQWVSGSVAETISEIFEATGNIRESIRWLRRCLRSCRQSLETLKKQRNFIMSSSLPLWIQAAMATIYVRLSERHINCLRRISLLYGKLGNHRKSEGYALTAAGNSEFLNVKTKSESSEILAMAYSSLATSGNNRELASHRLLVQVKAQATALDAVARALCGLDYQQSQPPCSDVFTQNWILNRISSLLVGKCNDVCYHCPTGSFS